MSASLLAQRLRARATYLYREDQRRISEQDHLDMMRAATLIEAVVRLQKAELGVLHLLEVNDELERRTDG